MKVLDMTAVAISQGLISLETWLSLAISLENKNNYIHS